MKNLTIYHSVIGTALLLSSAFFLNAETIYGKEVTTPGKYTMTYEVDGKIETAVVEVKPNQTELKLQDITIHLNEKWSPLDNVISLKDIDGLPLNMDKLTIKNNVNTQQIGIYFVMVSYNSYVSVAKVAVTNFGDSRTADEEFSKKTVTKKAKNQRKEKTEVREKVMLNDELLTRQKVTPPEKVKVSGGSQNPSSQFGNTLSFLSGTLLYGTRRV